MNLSEPLQPSGPTPAIAGQALLPGTQLGDYEILQVLGLTSFGVLYLCRHLADGSTAAIKEYMPATLASRKPDGLVDVTDPSHVQAYQRGLQAFLAEGLTLSQFEHPNLLRVHLVWEDNGTAYRSMPYLAGHTLLAWRASHPQPASQAQLQALLDGLLSALNTLYQAGLAHGQVEPLNIYLDENGLPILMDFDAVHQAVQSDLRKPHVDAYADPTRMQALVCADLHAVVAVLHFAVSGEWVAPRTGHVVQQYPALTDVLLRFKESASALQYQPEFLAAIDSALALPAGERPATITELRALFDAAASAPAPVAKENSREAPAKKQARRAKQNATPTPPPAYPLNSSASVLALLANFERGPVPAAEDVEPFQAPDLPTLTEEAEPALPPLRTNPFDELEDRDSQADMPADAPSDFEPLPYTPMPSIRRRNNKWQRLAVLTGMAVALVAAVGALGWQLFG